MRLRLMLLFLITLTVAGCGGGGGGGSSTNTTPVVTETVTAFSGGDKTLNGVGDLKTLEGTASSSTGSTLTYSWTVTSGDASKITFGTPSALSTSITATALGTYTVTFKATSAASGVSATSTATITVVARTTTETVTVAAGGDQTISGPGTGNAITLTGSANYTIGPVTYAWTATGANANKIHFGSANTAVTTVYADEPGTYTIYLSATSTADANVSASDSATITVLDDTVLGAKSSYFPLLPGSVWVYTETSTGNTIKKEVLNDYTIYQTVTSSSGTNHNDSRYTFYNNRVYLTETFVDGFVNGSAVTFTTSYNFNNQNSSDNPGQIVLPSSLTTNGLSESSTYQSATYTTMTGVTPTTRTTTVTVMGPESVTVGNNTYTAIKVRSVTGTNTSYGWYVQGIGLVKTDSMTLVSYTR